MIADIFIKSYRGDFSFLTYCLRSISKYARGFRDIVLVLPEADRQLIKGFNLTREKVHFVSEEGIKDPYLFQQVVKVQADSFTDADLIIYTDSDSVFLKEFTPETFMVKNKPYMLITPYSELGDAVPWKPITEKALGFECPFETMRRLPFVYKGKLLAPFRAHVESVHKKPIKDYIMSQPFRQFSEFNALGSWTLRMKPEEFFWWDTTDSNGLPEPVVRQEWSWGGLTPEIKKNLENILA